MLNTSAVNRIVAPHQSCRQDGAWVFRVSLSGTRWFRCTGCDIEAPETALRLESATSLA